MSLSSAESALALSFPDGSHTVSQGVPPLDPTTCYTEMLTLMRDGDSAAAREHALNLQYWLTRGGFCPPGHSLAEVKRQLSQALRATEPVQR